MSRKPKGSENNTEPPVETTDKKFASGATGEAPEIETPEQPEVETTAKPESDAEKKKRRNEYQREYRAKQKQGNRKAIPRKQDSPAPPKLELPSGVLASLWSTIFSITAKLRSYAGYQIDSDEAKILAEATLPVIEKYEADWAGEYAPEIGLGLAVVSVATPRIFADLDHREKGSRKNDAPRSSSESPADGTRQIRS